MKCIMGGFLPRRGRYVASPTALRNAKWSATNIDGLSVQVIWVMSVAKINARPNSHNIPKWA